MKIPETCFECEDGHYDVIIKPYEDRGPDGAIVTVPDVKVLCCSLCDDEIIPAESDRYISRFVAEANEQLTKAELFAMLEASGRTQKDFAETIGLGEKTFHRWLKGTQIASRSMGYYLRAITTFPEVFNWVEGRKWRTQMSKAPYRIETVKNQSDRFRALALEPVRPARPIHNPARGFSKVRVSI